MNRPEDAYVKIPALIHATRVGYTYVSLRGRKCGEDYHGETNIFVESFRRGLEKVNGRVVESSEAWALIREISALASGEDLGRAFYESLHSGVAGMRLIDFDSPSNNVFEVVTELPYEHGDDSFRPDIVFLVNGMPLGFMEVKRQNNREGILAERDRMKRRFANEIYRKFANITQLMVFSNNQAYEDGDRHLIHGSYYAATSYTGLHFSHFREQEPEVMLARVAPRNAETERKILLDNNLAAFASSGEFESSINPETPANSIITSLFSPERFLFLVRYGFAYVKKVNDDGVEELQKHVMRYPQMFASFAVRAALDAGGKKGIVWHTQGSGKTALAYFLTRYLRDYYQRRGVVSQFFFIVDRLELADQAKREFENRGASVQVVSSRRVFAELLSKASDSSDEVRANRPPVITVVNIQKFNDEEAAEDFAYDALRVQRVYFIDEAHRDYKNGGAFLTRLVTSDRGAVKLALTGTPLIDARKGNATKQVFGDYIHKYYYNQSIADGYTLRLLREDVRTGFRMEMESVVKDLRELDRSIRIADVLRHPRYVEPLTDYIVDDYFDSRDRLDDDSIGAMIVAADSQQARAVAQRLEDFGPDVSYALILHDHESKEWRRVKQAEFKDGKIDILVVNSMLLTGFDAPRLKKLYLCRKIKAHNLLQALTRVNRPYKDMSFGYVVDFADITEEYDKTNRAYLAELREELEDAVDEYSNMFVSEEQIVAELEEIKDLLFEFTTDNIVEFQNELACVREVEKLYALRRALARYTSLKNVAKAHGFQELYARFDVEKARQLLREVELRIASVNLKKAMEIAERSTGAMNVALSQIRFHFRRLGEAELKVADEFGAALRGAWAAAGTNTDPSDPEFVNLVGRLKELFAQRDIEEMTAQEMVASIDEMRDIKRQIDDLNRRDAALAGKYSGDVKFLRAHKRARRVPSPLAGNDRKLHGVLMAVKNETDEKLVNNSGMLGNRAVFERQVRRDLLQACKRQDVACTLEQIKDIGAFIAREYVDEGGRAA